MGEPYYDRASTLSGSVHVLSDGYGNGVRVLTARNQMTLPHSVPQYRHLPDTPQFKKDTTCTRLIQTESGQRRNAEQVSKQTSGEYGKYLIEHRNSFERLNMGKSSHQINVATGKWKDPGEFSARSNQHSSRIKTLTSSREPFYQPMNTDRYNNNALDRTIPMDLTSTGGSAPGTGRSIGSSLSRMSSSGQGGGSDVYRTTLVQLDTQYENRNRRDLQAATLPHRGNLTKYDVDMIASIIIIHSTLY